MKCLHETFDSEVSVGRITKGEGGPVESFMAHVKIHCTQCKTPMQFIGLPLGLQLRGAAMSPDGQEARIAIVPAGEAAHPLEGVTGFSIGGRPPVSH